MPVFSQQSNSSACAHPVLVKKLEIFSNDKTVAEFWFDGLDKTPNAVLFVKDTNGFDTPYPIEPSGRVLIQNLERNQKYAVSISDSCGVPLVIDSINRAYRGNGYC